MKHLLIYRGDNVREENTTLKRNYTDLIINWENHYKVFIEECYKNGDTCDVAIISYYSNIIPQIIEKIKPKFIFLHEKINQRTNFENVLKLMTTYKNEYDRFIISRCDISYKLPLSKWPQINKKGIFVAGKNVLWPKYRIYADTIFICDNLYINLFIEAYNFIALNVCETHLHALAEYLFRRNYNFICMYDKYYHLKDNPLTQLTSEEGLADLENPLPSIEVTDLTPWY